MIHVTATYPLRAGCHPYLITHPVVADRCASGVRAVKEIIARLLRVVPARIAHAIMDGVVPVVIVIGVLPVPAAIVGFKRVVCPANTGICTRNDDALPGETESPYVRRVRVSDPPLDRRRSARLRTSDRNGAPLRKRIVNLRVAFYTGHIGPDGQCLRDLPSAFH